jgi:hypothetical protein
VKRAKNLSATSFISRDVMSDKGWVSEQRGDATILQRYTTVASVGTGILHGLSQSLQGNIRAGRPRLDSQQRQGRDFFSSLLRPDRLWVPLRLLFSGYWDSFPGG